MSFEIQEDSISFKHLTFAKIPTPIRLVTKIIFERFVSQLIYVSSNSALLIWWIDEELSTLPVMYTNGKLPIWDIASAAFLRG